MKVKLFSDRLANREVVFSAMLGLYSESSIVRSTFEPIYEDVNESIYTNENPLYEVRIRLAMVRFFVGQDVFVT